MTTTFYMGEVTSLPHSLNFEGRLLLIVYKKKKKKAKLVLNVEIK